jgi:hypothetical protein
VRQWQLLRRASHSAVRRPFLHASDEHGQNSAPYIVLSYGYWQSRFRSDPGIVGHTIRLNKHPFTVIGVAPLEFHGTLQIFTPDFYVPFADQEEITGKNDLENRMRQTVFMTLGHLNKGVTLEQATADLNSIGPYLEETYPREHGTTTFKLARPGLYGNYLGSPMRAFVAGLMGLAGLILLAACHQPRQPVRLAGGRPFPRGRAAACAWSEPEPHRAPVAHRGRTDFTRGRRCWALGQCRAAARAGGMESASAVAHACPGHSGRECVRDGFASGSR